MKTVIQLNKWANAHTHISIDIIRVATGLLLFMKGVQFASQTDYLLNIIRPNHPEAATLFLVHYVAMSHLAGGALIAMGLLTRLSALVQLPILIGAFLINFTGAMDIGNLIQASLLLIAAVFFIFYGSGKHSVDYSLKMNM